MDIIGRTRWAAWLLSTWLAMVPAAGGAAEAGRMGVLLDTDIGSAIDDAFALALVIAIPELELRGVTTVGGNAEDRAWMICRFLTAVDRRGVPVAWGQGPQPDYEIDWQIQYRRHPGVIFDRTAKPVRQPAEALLYERLKAEPGKLTVIALGPLTNVARLLANHPEAKPWIKRIVWMGGAVRTGYDGRPPAVSEWNLKSDVKAARTVLASGVPLSMVPLDATAGLKFSKPMAERTFAAATPLTFQVQALYQLSGESEPTLHDAAAIAMALDDKFFEVEALALEITEAGMLRTSGGQPNARVAMSARGEELLSWLIERLTGFARPALPQPPQNLSTLVSQGGLPLRVHAHEDYETDIEKRWWMSGKLETVDAPPGSKRACRAVLTQDFDAKMGDLSTMYRAVIFNPVPGPPMARNTRLSFRYKLSGADTLRVQLYSLTNGYHRYLALTGLPQGRWEEGTVDMTQMRRPDGSGGPLASDERIDDIQFYVDPRADLLIDDVVLYEPAAADEQRKFPQRILFTGWFDTGKQGREWPGSFEIAGHQPPRTWKAAVSIPGPQDLPWIRLGLRGERPLGEMTRLVFRYRLTGSDTMEVAMVYGASNRRLVRRLAGLESEQWLEATTEFPTAEFTATGQGAKTDPPLADALEFTLPGGGQLQVDDVLLYEPGDR